MKINKLMFTELQGTWVMLGMFAAAFVGGMRPDIENKVVYILSGGISGYLMSTCAVFIMHLIHFIRSRK